MAEKTNNKQTINCQCEWISTIYGQLNFWIHRVLKGLLSHLEYMLWSCENILWMVELQWLCDFLAEDDRCKVISEVQQNTFLTSSAASCWVPPLFHMTAGGTLWLPGSVLTAGSPAPPSGHNPNLCVNTGTGTQTHTHTHTHTRTYSLRYFCIRYLGIVTASTPSHV